MIASENNQQTLDSLDNHNKISHLDLATFGIISEKKKIIYQLLQNPLKMFTANSFTKKKKTKMTTTKKHDATIFPLQPLPFPKTSQLIRVLAARCFRHTLY